MEQQVLTMAKGQSFGQYRNPKRHGHFLETMNSIVPWTALCAMARPHYLKLGKDQPPLGLGRILILRIHYLPERHRLGERLFAEAYYVLQRAT